MEEAPKPTFQDELEWCISQLETGLRCLNPTPKQAEETHRILGVLRSRKAPLGKKRQVMHRVFGDYRLKMTEEREKAAKAAVEPVEVHIQPGDGRPSGSTVYRKQSSHSSGASTSWFTPSDHSFQFGFVLPEKASEEVGGTTETSKMDNSGKESSNSGSCGLLGFSTETEKPEFAFNFVIQDVPQPSDLAGDPDSEAMTEIAKGVDSSCIKTMLTSEDLNILDPERPDVDNGGGKNEESPVQEAPKADATPVAKPEAGSTKPAVAADGASKRKKKKKQVPLRTSHSDNVNGDSRSHGKAMSGLDEACQSEEQMKREVDWCVEQLELGLKTQKSTAKQSSEALRAIRILRSEKVVLPKKRQVMRATCGDYRAKMAEERRRQLKLLQAASKAAHISEVMGESCRRKGRVLRKSTVLARRDANPAGSGSKSPASTAGTRTADSGSLVFVPCQEEFCFNFF